MFNKEKTLATLNIVAICVHQCHYCRARAPLHSTQCRDHGILMIIIRLWFQVSTAAVVWAGGRQRKCDFWHGAKPQWPQKLGTFLLTTEAFLGYFLLFFYNLLIFFLILLIIVKNLPTCITFSHFLSVLVSPVPKLHTSPMRRYATALLSAYLGYLLTGSW